MQVERKNLLKKKRVTHKKTVKKSSKKSKSKKTKKSAHEKKNEVVEKEVKYISLKNQDETKYTEQFSFATLLLTSSIFFVLRRKKKLGMLDEMKDEKTVKNS